MTQTTQQKENEDKNEIFDLVLVDINKSKQGYIECVKKNMYNPELKYIAISYRWGELNEQQLETPDYTAHITSFHLWDLYLLCEYIKFKPDLKNIDYLWVDAISVDQQNHSRKKDTILKMNQIYQNSTYILAIPDLHLQYLIKNTANQEIIELIRKYKKTIYYEISNDKHSDTNTITDDINSSITTTFIRQQHTNNDYNLIIQKLKNKNINEDMSKIIEELEIVNKEKEKEMNELKIEMKKIKIENEELKVKNKKLRIEMKKNKNRKIKGNKEKIYQFLAYLIEDWSNRAWVISEYHIAKEKYIKYGTPLKYWFISLGIDNQPFFSYHFNDVEQKITINNEVLGCEEVSDPILFNQFVKSRFMQRSHLEMILNSNAKRNEDRFNAILPSWNRYNHIIKNKNTISDWNITDMTSVRLKLYEIMDNLWDKATLLKACRFGTNLPTFASEYNSITLYIIEKVNYNNIAYKEFEESLLEYISGIRNEKEAFKIKQLINKYHANYKSIRNENLASIQFKPHHCYLSVKSKLHFITSESDLNEEENCRIKLSLDDGDKVHLVFIPFFTSNLPGYIDYVPIYEYGSKIYLVGNRNKNKWILFGGSISYFESEDFCSDDYTFNIY